jgi:hypothetical protein
MRWTRSHVHLLVAVEQSDEAESRIRELEAEAEGAIQDRGHLVQTGDLDRDGVQRLQLLAKALRSVTPSSSPSRYRALLGISPDAPATYI